MKETVETIIQWSKDTFGDNITLEGQLEKFTDEVNEWFASDGTDIKELADLAIVASSVARFSVVEAMRCFHYTLDRLYFSKFTPTELEKAINNKMAINRKRKWGVGKGNFQHISEGEESVE